LREDFAIELDVGGFELSNETAVGEFMHAGGGTEASLPESAHVALFLFAVSKLKTPCVKEGFFGCAEFALAAPFEALGMLEQAFAALVGTGYLGGAMMANITIGYFPVLPGIFILVLWAGMELLTCNFLKICSCVDCKTESKVCETCTKK
jgi:hypothetical protein